MKTEIYTWRLSRDLKDALEFEARREKVSIAVLLERGVTELLRQRGSQLADDEAEQSRLHAQARRSIGKIAGPDPMRAESARRLIRERLARKNGR